MLTVSLTFQLVVSSVPAQPGRRFAASTGAGQADFVSFLHCILKPGDLRYSGHTWRDTEIHKKLKRASKLLCCRTQDLSKAGEGYWLTSSQALLIFAKLGCIEFGKNLNINRNSDTAFSVSRTSLNLFGQF